MPKQRDRLFLSIIGLADLRPLRPWIVLRPDIRRFGHHLDLCHGLRAEPDRSAHAVVSGVTAADDHHVLSLCRHIGVVRKVGIEQALCHAFQKIHREINPLCIPSRRIDVPRIGGAAREHDPVKTLHELLRFDIYADIGVCEKFHTFFLHDPDLAVDDVLLELHVRNPVHQKPAKAVAALEHGDVVPPLVQLIRHGKPCGSAADHRDSLVRAHLGRSRVRKPCPVRILDDRILVLLRRHRVAV